MGDFVYDYDPEATGDCMDTPVKLCGSERAVVLPISLLHTVSEVKQDLMHSEELPEAASQGPDSYEIRLFHKDGDLITPEEEDTLMKFFSSEREVLGIEIHLKGNNCATSFEGPPSADVLGVTFK